MDRRKAEQTKFVLKEEEENDDEAYRHTYYEEQLLMQAVQDGRQEDAIRIVGEMDADAGRLSADEIGHWRNLAIVDMTLCARAAIHGGLPPETAYRISGFYIRKCDALREVSRILHYRNRAIEELSSRVLKLHTKPTTSHYTEQCKDYIRKHYRESIRVNDVADLMGISPEYLSRLFHKETGTTIQEFVNQIRCERAANLLSFSSSSLSEIAEYVHFPSQSYFGKMFRRFYHVTPGVYRKQTHSRELL